MPQFLLILRGPVSDDREFSAQEMQQVIERYDAWSEGLAQQGLLKGGQKLTDGAGKVMMAPPGGAGDLVVKDGPYIETKEVVGGYYLIKADSYDHAVELCREHPNFLFGSVEIREIDWMGEAEED